ncbi:ROK family protein [Bifidobacterium stellenboschense]|uniref:Sugar kinase n=1 Tax=Bifidobacterium stellenboschense TaxID=762211 RepID=A0A087E0A0_9BIFI|nr:ROK family protein [Bifidobacterium stellenboschense]KFJ01201.1 sugar kinase [Bifidobacterium stellenboschense]
MTDTATGPCLVGVDIGGTKIEAALMRPDGTVAVTTRMPARRGGDNVVADVEAIVRAVAAERLADVAAVGVGIPGQVDAAIGLVSNVVNLDITSLELGALAGARLGVPVHVENDVNAAALGAARIVSDEEDDAEGTEPDGPVAFLNFGTGLAAGIIIDGELHHGASGAAGEIGHIPVDPNRFDCPCGQRGCLETVCSGAAVTRLWPTGGEDALSDLIIQAAQGEPEAGRILGMVKHAMGDAIQILAQSVDPRTIVIGGGMARIGEPLLRIIGDELSARASVCPFLAGLRLEERLRLAPADRPVGALGAALAARPYASR